ncbi:hypothetical protein GJ496_003146, partial [Pomphorhynchus laevis]
MLFPQPLQSLLEDVMDIENLPGMKLQDRIP